MISIAGTVKCFFFKRGARFWYTYSFLFSALVFQLISYLAHMLLLIVSTDGSKWGRTLTKATFTLFGKENNKHTIYPRESERRKKRESIQQIEVWLWWPKGWSCQQTPWTLSETKHDAVFKNRKWCYFVEEYKKTKNKINNYCSMYYATECFFRLALWKLFCVVGRRPSNV